MTDDLARRLAPALAPWFHTRDGSRDLGRGTAFPSTDVPGGVQAGDRFFRTDLIMACVYTGSLWLTLNEWTTNLSQTTTSANASYLISPIRTDYAIYVTVCAVGALVAATNNATNYWTIDLRGINSTYSAATTIHSAPTNAAAAGAWVLSNSAPNVAAQPANHAGLDVSVAKAGSGAAPGALAFAAQITYRLVVT